MTCFYWLRTIIFYIVFVLWTALWCTWVMLTVYAVPVHSRQTYSAATYGLVVAWMCRLICGIRWRIEGKEHIPDSPCVVASNHQSTWETFYLQLLFTPQATITKKELLKIPVFGWAFQTLKPIAIDRGDPRRAMRQIHQQGMNALKNQYWVVIFPEGTRYNWPEIGRYTRGAATLAANVDVPILPIVHNAGCFWPNKKWLKKPGEIIMRIGPPINTKERSAKEINDELENWTKTNMLSASDTTGCASEET